MQARKEVTRGGSTHPVIKERLIGRRSRQMVFHSPSLRQVKGNDMLIQHSLQMLKVLRQQAYCWAPNIL
ncbi:hypothetical protein D3C74_168940 [compost metagenome]